jgi:hypothetical protein
MIKAYFESFLAFIKSVFSDNGVGSSSRVLSGAVVFSTLFWITYVVFKTKTIPDLGGPSMFMATGVGVFMGTNKAADMISAFKGK